MTTVDLSGKKITEIEYGDEFDIVSVAGGTSGSPGMISPSGAAVTVALLTNGTGSNTVYKMDGAFNVGDVVEVYNQRNDRGPNTVLDENASDISPSNGGLGRGSRIRKTSSGASPPTWGIIG